MSEDERLKTLEIRVSSLERDAAVDTALRSTIEKRLSSIEDTLKWLVRLVLGAVILALLGFVMSNGMSV